MNKLSFLRSDKVGLITDCNIFHGINQAIQSLCQPSTIQHQVRTSLTDNLPTIHNRGRIICLTSFKG